MNYISITYYFFHFLPEKLTGLLHQSKYKTTVMNYQIVGKLKRGWRVFLFMLSSVSGFFILTAHFLYLILYLTSTHQTSSFRLQETLKPVCRAGI